MREFGAAVLVAIALTLVVGMGAASAAPATATPVAVCTYTVQVQPFMTVTQCTDPNGAGYDSIAVPLAQAFPDGNMGVGTISFSGGSSSSGGQYRGYTMERRVFPFTVRIIHRYEGGVTTKTVTVTYTG